MDTKKYQKLKFDPNRVIILHDFCILTVNYSLWQIYYFRFHHNIRLVLRAQKYIDVHILIFVVLFVCKDTLLKTILPETYSLYFVSNFAAILLI
jgi:hypothetical protein